MRSDFEKQVRTQLESRGVAFSYESTKLNYFISGNYITDFVLGSEKKALTKDEIADKIILEVKGFLDVDTRKKMLAVKEAHPDLEIRFVFQQNGFVYKNKKGKPRRTPESPDMRYSDWCEKHGFKWCVGEIPDVWLKEIKRTGRKSKTSSRDNKRSK
jgi:hypothetical protein